MGRRSKTVPWNNAGRQSDPNVKQYPRPCRTHHGRGHDMWLDCGSFHPCGCSSLIIGPSTAEFESDKN